MSLRAAATSVVSPGEPELLDTDEQEAVIAGLVRSHETSVRVWKVCALPCPPAWRKWVGGGHSRD
jgi:hypothetical protein